MKRGPYRTPASHTPSYIKTTHSIPTLQQYADMEDSFVSWIDGRIECGAARCVSFPSFLLSFFLPKHRELPERRRHGASSSLRSSTTISLRGKNKKESEDRYDELMNFTGSTSPAARHRQHVTLSRLLLIASSPHRLIASSPHRLISSSHPASSLQLPQALHGAPRGAPSSTVASSTVASSTVASSTVASSTVASSTVASSKPTPSSTVASSKPTPSSK